MKQTIETESQTEYQKKKKKKIKKKKILKRRKENRLAMIELGLAGDRP